MHEAAAEGQGARSVTRTVVVVNGERYSVPPQGLRIGRAPDNDVVLPDPNVSRQHLVLWSTPRGAFLRDLGSQNGTYIGTRRVGAGPESIPSGARVRIGTTDLAVEIVGEPAAPRRSGGQTNMLVAGALVALVIVMLGTGALILRAVAGSRESTSAQATATPSSKPVVASTAVASPSPSPSPVAVATVAPTPASSPTVAAVATAGAAVDNREAFTRALRASVRVIVPTSQTTASTGSGSVISAKGHILTNFHVISDERTGQLINQGRDIIIAVAPTENDPAQPKFRARVVEYDSKMDLAVLQVSALANGGPLPANLGLTPVPIGDSDTVRINDPLIIIGFPSLGGSSVTVTRGIHSGIQRFTDDPGQFIKTDTEINPGNSGGSAINSDGQLIGIPTAGRFSRETPGKIGLIRPINLAKPLIEKALR
ncbi:MAG: trypsin-like peptidase domain-containing protein [Chloroflexi bacterium]|nr:trypsin-like peptidase domain-containing protein [Chloroflexota bacterium]